VAKSRGGSVVFGKSIALLLVALFGLAGVQMVLTQLRESAGLVLGESNEGQGKLWNKTVTPTPNVAPPSVLPPPPVTTVAPTTVAPPTTVVTPTQTPTVAPVVTPTVIITPEPTPMPAQIFGGYTPPISAPVEVKSNSGVVITTTNVVDRSTNEIVRQIINKIGITTAPAPARVVPPTIKTAVKAVEQKTAGEILRELATLPSQSGSPQVRLRYKFVNGVMTLVSETDTGQEKVLSASESATIIGQLTRSAALEVRPGGSGEMIFTKGQIRAVTELPLLVDLRTNLLTTETSTGIKTVPLLPDEAIKIAFASRVLDGVYPKKSNAEIVFSEAENGHLQYEIAGMSKRKLFGLIRLALNETALVDAGNGQVTQPDKSLGQLLVELIALPGGGR